MSLARADCAEEVNLNLTRCLKGHAMLTHSGQDVEMIRPELECP